MSRKIDMSDPSSWTVADRQYLQDRNMLPADAVNVGPAKVHSNSNTLPPNTGTVSAGLPQDKEEDVLFDGKADDYNGMTAEQLKDELRGRGLAVSGTKNELMYRLRADDDNPDEDVEDEEEFDSEEDEDD